MFGLEWLPLVAAPTFSAILAPILVTYINKRLNERKSRQAAEAERRKKDLEEDKYNDELSRTLRSELSELYKNERSENRDLRAENDQLRQQAVGFSTLQLEVDAWKKKYYSLKKENQNLKFEFDLLKKEIEILRRQHEQYLAIRERARDQFGGPDEKHG